MSLRPPNVQEIVRDDPFQIPENFLVVTNEGDEPKSADTNHDLSSEIPIIDFSLLVAGHKEELNKLDKACEEWGFFLLVKHGIAAQVLQEMKDGAAKFFDLPLEEKNKIEMPSDEFQGYGQAYALSEGQTMDWSDALFLTVYPSQYRNPRFWPTTPNGFKPDVRTIVFILAKLLAAKKKDGIGLGVVEESDLVVVEELVEIGNVPTLEFDGSDKNGLEVDDRFGEGAL